MGGEPFRIDSYLKKNKGKNYKFLWINSEI